MGTYAYDWMRSIPRHSAQGQLEPVVAVLAASTTRGIRSPSPQSLALCTYLLRSLVRTAECGYRYIYVLGYDQGEPYFDGRDGLLGKAVLCVIAICVTFSTFLL